MTQNLETNMQDASLAEQSSEKCLSNQFVTGIVESLNRLMPLYRIGFIKLNMIYPLN
jgi:hypothetical protein